MKTQFGILCKKGSTKMSRTQAFEQAKKNLERKRGNGGFDHNTTGGK